MTDWFDPRTLFGDQHLTVSDMLPLQVNASVSDLSPSKTEEENKGNLPIVPQGNLKEILLGKFDDPEIPSGIPTDEQQNQAFTHRLIGNAVGDTVANLQNTANILKPGSGNPAMGDSSRRFGEMLAQRALGNAHERRQEALQNFQLKDLTDQRHERMYQQALALKQMQDHQDPMSASSRQSQQQEAQRLDMLAAASSPEVQAQIAQRKSMLPGLSAAAIEIAQKSDPLQELVKLRSQETQAGAKLSQEKTKDEREAKRQDSQTAIGWGQLSESKREHDLMDADRRASLAEKGKNSQLRLIGQQAPLIDDIAKLAMSANQLKEGASMLKGNGGSFSPDVVSDAAQSVKGALPNFIADSTGLKPDANYTKFWGEKMQPAVQQIRLALEKTVKNNPFMMKQLESFLPHKGDNEQQIKQKLDNLVPYLRQQMGSKVAQLRVDPETGEPIDKSALAQHLSGVTGIDATDLLQNYLSPQAASKTKSASPGTIKSLKSGGKAQQQPDGSWKRIE